MTKKLNRGVLIDGDLLRKELTAYMLDKGLSLRPACESLGLVYVTVNNAFRGKRVDYKTVAKLRALGFAVSVLDDIGESKIKPPKKVRIVASRGEHN